MNSAPMRVASSALRATQPPPQPVSAPCCAATTSSAATGRSACAPIAWRGFPSPRPCRDKQRDRRRDEGEREQQGAEQAHHHRERHRVEHLSLDAGQREDGHVHRATMMTTPNRLGLITSRVASNTVWKRSLPRQQAPQPVLLLADPAQAVLDDDHRAIDDQAEVQRAQAHQIARHPVLHHAGDGEQHRQRNHRRGDQRRAPVAEQQEQHDDHQQRAFQQVGGHRAMVRSTSAVRS
jgi:hypothetical protein